MSSLRDLVAGFGTVSTNMSSPEIGTGSTGLASDTYDHPLVNQNQFRLYRNNLFRTQEALHDLYFGMRCAHLEERIE